MSKQFLAHLVYMYFLDAHFLSAENQLLCALNTTSALTKAIAETPKLFQKQKGYFKVALSIQ